MDGGIYGEVDMAIWERIEEEVRRRAEENANALLDRLEEETQRMIPADGSGFTLVSARYTAEHRAMFVKYQQDKAIQAMAERIARLAFSRD